MAPQCGREVPAVIDQLFADARWFDFFQAVRLLERSARHLGAAEGRPPRHPVGYDGSPQQEVVRFRAQQSLTFPTSDVERLSVPARGGEGGAAGPSAATEAPPEMFVNFMGLTGPSGVLPRHYTQLVLEQTRDGANALPEFFDLFNHRLTSLFYRAWEKYRAAILVERSRYLATRREVDLFTFAVCCLVGLGTGGQRGRMAVDDDVFLYYAGCFSHRPANALSLQLILIEFLQAKVQVRPLHGQWLRLSTEDRTRLPAAGEPPTIAVQLGKGAVAGERVWDLQSKFRIRAGPIGYALFCRLMPSGDTLLPLCQVTRTYAGPEWDFDVQLVLRGEEVPWCRLDGTSRLGWSTWVRCREFEREVDDVVFHLPYV